MSPCTRSAVGPQGHRQLSGVLLLHSVRDVSQGRIAAPNLTLEDRCACVEYVTAEGLTVPEIAVTMGVCDRTVNRDRRAIRRANALKPSQALGDELVSELRARAESSIARLRRAVRDTGDGQVTPHM